MKKRGFLLTFLLLTLFGGQKWLEKQYFDFSQIDPNRKPLRILALHRNGTGEKEAMARMKRSCQKLGWEFYDCTSRPSFWKRHLLFNPLKRVIEAVNPDFTLNFQCKDKFAPGINFVSLASGIHLYFGEKGHLDLKKMTAFDGFLPTFQEIGTLETKIEEQGVPFHGMVWLFTCPHQPYTPLELRSLFYCGANWDQTRKGSRYQKFFSLLDQRKDISIFGPPRSWKFLKQTYKGLIPFDGESLTRAMQKAGIVLILHTDSHIQGNSPTARIFEATAASCLVISDLHPFVIKEFGDTVLYIDQTKEPEEIAKQIDEHMHWIQTHPEEARTMAQKAHQIFEERFTLEAQLLRLKNLYIEMISGAENMSRRCPDFESGKADTEAAKLKKV